MAEVVGDVVTNLLLESVVTVLVAVVIRELVLAVARVAVGVVVADLVESVVADVLVTLTMSGRQAEWPSAHVCALFPPTSPHCPLQAPPRAQQLRLPFGLAPHVGHLSVIKILVERVVAGLVALIVRVAVAAVVLTLSAELLWRQAS